MKILFCHAEARSIYTKTRLCHAEARSIYMKTRLCHAEARSISTYFMKIKRNFYFVYIVTNKRKTVLYTGVTNDLEQRITEHYLDRLANKTFAGKYNCHLLILYESFKYINDAIAREKEIKGWLRIKKAALITNFNPDWKFLNEELFGEWPPKSVYHRKHD